MALTDPAVVLNGIYANRGRLTPSRSQPAPKKFEDTWSRLRSEPKLVRLAQHQCSASAPLSPWAAMGDPTVWPTNHLDGRLDLTYLHRKG